MVWILIVVKDLKELYALYGKNDIITALAYLIPIFDNPNLLNSLMPQKGNQNTQAYARYFQCL